MNFDDMDWNAFKAFLNDNKANIRIYGHIDYRLDDNGCWTIYEGKYDLSKDDTYCVSLIRGQDVQDFYINCLLRMVRDSDEKVKIIVGQPT